MIFFHPTLSFRETWRTFFQSSDNNLESSLEKRFPDHDVKLVDSGKSALALIIKSFNLEGKSIALPAYLCEDILDVLVKYNIKPIFLDVDSKNFIPTKEHYSTEIMKEIDAVLLVRTYGLPFPSKIISYLKENGKVVIEDWAHCYLPREAQNLESDARFYSFTKTYPVPDGGLVVSKRKLRSINNKPNFKLGYLRNLIKLTKLGYYLLSIIKRVLPKEDIVKSNWKEISRIRKTSKKIMSNLMKDSTWGSKNNPAFIPFLTNEPKTVSRKVKREGIEVRRMWHNPIIKNPRTKNIYKVNPKDFPKTLEVAQKVLVVPAWHTKNQQEYENLQKHLKEIL